MRIQIFICLLLYLANSSVGGQTDSVSLLRCFEATRLNAAIRPQITIMQEIADLNISNVNSTNLPSLSAYGKATYQNDAIALPNGFELDLFQYNVGIEADQKIYDGGIARKNKELESATLESEQNRIESELYQLNNQTVQYFFSSLLFLRNKEVIQLKKDILQKRVAELQSAYDLGVIPRNELDKLKTEVMTARQQEMEVEKLRLQALSALRILTGLGIASETELYVPDSIYKLKSITRPEYSYFDAETKRLESLVSLKWRQNIPKISAFGQLGYSYPGLNIFENQSDYYYILGAKMAWPILDWQQVKRETQVIHKQQEVILTKRTEFDQKILTSIDREKIEQEKLQELIAMDEEIIIQRNSIAVGSASALQNGVITSAAYMEDLNNEIRARIELETHRIQLINSIVRLYLLNGIEINGL